MNQVIRDTLQESAGCVDVPRIDEVALARRVRALRGRHRAKLATAVVAAVAVPAVAVPLALNLARDGEAYSPNGVTGVPGGSTLGTVAFALEGTLHLQPPEQYAGGSRDTGIEVQDVITVRQDGVLVTDTDSRVLLVPFDGGTPTLPLGAQPVQQVSAAADGTVGWQDLAGRVHLRLLGGAGGLVESDVPDPRLLGAGGRRLLLDEGMSVSLADGRAKPAFVMGATDVMEAQLGGETAAVTLAGGTVFATVSGEKRTDVVAGRIGALSSDGRWFVANPNPEETAAGMVRGLTAWDTGTGEAREFTGFDDTGYVIDAAWQGDRALVVVSTDADGQEIRSLYSCSVETLTCAYHYEDESGTLKLPRP